MKCVALGTVCKTASNGFDSNIVEHALLNAANCRLNYQWKAVRHVCLCVFKANMLDKSQLSGNHDQ